MNDHPPHAGPAPGPAWPSVPVAAWEGTRDTLHLWSQVIGKVCLARTPLVNHWWNATLHVTARGLATPLLPGGPGPSFQMEFDFLGHRLGIATADGRQRTVALEPKSVADFYAEVMARLDELDLATPIWPVPVEIEGAIPFPDDRDHASYDPEAVTRFWQSLVQADRVMRDFRSRFLGKASPVHFFWGAFDLAVTRFSGREAPPHPGGAPNTGPHVMHEAYSHEVSSCGYWPGGNAEGTFYAYAYPEPAGFAEWPVPAGAHYLEGLGEFVLPYESVRTADDPDGLLMAFLQATYEAAAEPGGWDRPHLEHR
jgi:hypothetical protein